MRTAKIIAASLGSLALVVGSTATAAAAPPLHSQAVNPWLVATSMSSAPAAAIAGAAAAQPMDVPPNTRERGPIAVNGEIVAMLPLFVLIMVAVFTDDEHGPEAVSPA